MTVSFICVKAKEIPSQKEEEDHCPRTIQRKFSRIPDRKSPTSSKEAVIMREKKYFCNYHTYTQNSSGV